MTTTQIVNQNNKLIEQNLISKIKDLPIINIHFSTIKDKAYNEQILQLTEKQNTNFKNLINETHSKLF